MQPEPAPDLLNEGEEIAYKYGHHGQLRITTVERVTPTQAKLAADSTRLYRQVRPEEKFLSEVGSGGARYSRTSWFYWRATEADRVEAARTALYEQAVEVLKNTLAATPKMSAVQLQHIIETLRED